MTVAHASCESRNPFTSRLSKIRIFARVLIEYQKWPCLVKLYGCQFNIVEEFVIFLVLRLLLSLNFLIVTYCEICSFHSLLFILKILKDKRTDVFLSDLSLIFIQA